MKLSIILFTNLYLAVAGFAQTGGYYISRKEILPEYVVTAETFSLSLPSNREDVKAIGMGKTQNANGKGFNAMMYNPALLANEQIRFELPGVYASLPTKSFDAISFLRDNTHQFKTGEFIKSVKQGLRELKTASNEQEALAALRKIQSGARFAHEMQEALGGTDENPKTHGVSVIPSLSAQIGNFGVSLYGVAQSGFQLVSGPSVAELARVKIPDRLDQLTIEDYISLATAVEPLFDATGQLNEDALPVVYSVSYIDIVGAVGYAIPVSDEFCVGANVKVLNRRFSSKRVAANYFDKILSEVRSDFNTSITGVTLDLGALYKSPTGTHGGISVQNLIPMKTLTSNMNVRRVQTGILDYDRDQFGNIIVTNGDTALVAGEQKVRVIVPIELKSPLVVNVGMMHPLTENWDVALDVADVAAQDDLFEDYLHRIRVGTEFRLDAMKDKLGIAFRAGLAEKRPTFGIGLNLFRFLQIDGAFAHDTFTDENSYFAQVKLGW